MFEVLPYPTFDPSVPQKDTEQIRAGMEYVFIRGRLKLPLRVGYFNDRQYFRPSPRRASAAGDHPDGGPAVRRLDRRPRASSWAASSSTPRTPTSTGSYTDLQANAVRAHSHRVFTSFIYRHSSH